MTKILPTSLMTASILTASLMASFFSSATLNLISLAQVTKDVTYLASDDLKGRGNFSPEIKQAANYIAKRFEENGLTGAKGIAAQGFLQKYTITQISTDKISVMLNGKNIVPENLAMVSNAKTVAWQSANGVKNTNFTIHTVGKSDNLRTTLGDINKQGGEHLILLHPAQKKMFTRYQNYFGRGLIKPTSTDNNTNNLGTIVIALSDLTSNKITSVNVTATNTVSSSELTNVIAVLPGNTKPNEIVIYSAHYDHLGVKNTEGDNIYNGADDDASGTAAIINIAQHYAKLGNNARTLMFAAFSAEEIGGFGSQYFSKQLDPNSITAMINIEMIGKPSKFGAGKVWMTGMERSNLGEQLNQVLAESGNEIYKDPYPEQGLFYRSDNATLARLGVPAHSFSSTQLDKDLHYHNVSDDVSSLDLPSLHKVIEALAIATQPLADGSITPSRIDVNTIRNKGLIY